MDCHLVAVKVRVIRCADKRVNANCLTFNQHRFKCLDRQPVQRRSSVQEYRMTLSHFLENIPDLRSLAFDHLLRAANRVNVAELFESSNNERLKQNERHFLRQSALMELQFRPNHNHGTSGVIHTFPEQVLTESATFTFEHVAQRFERTVSGAGYRTAVAAVIE